jgi:hypothetical protein
MNNWQKIKFGRRDKKTIGRCEMEEEGDGKKHKQTNKQTKNVKRVNSLLVRMVLNRKSISIPIELNCLLYLLTSFRNTILQLYNSN